MQITDSLKPFAPKRLQASKRPRTVKEIVAHWKNKVPTFVRSFVRSFVCLLARLVAYGMVCDTSRRAFFLRSHISLTNPPHHLPALVWWVLQMGAPDRFSREDVQRLMALAQQHQVGAGVCMRMQLGARAHLCCGGALCIRSKH